MRLSPIALAALLVACAEAEPRLPFAPAGPDAAPDPSAPGPFAVGVRTLTLTDPARPSPYGEGRRPLVVEVWYPAAESARGAPGSSYDLFSVIPDSIAVDLDAGEVPPLETGAVRDAPPRRAEGPYPLVLFSHGSGGVRMQSTFYTERLASHGYVVVAPDHAGNTLSDFVSVEDFDFGDIVGSYTDRGLDLLFLLDRFTRLPDTEPLAELIDPERIGTSGHSFGALTSLRVAGLDRRVKAAVPHAPPGYLVTWLEVDRPLETLGTPILVLAGRDDRSLPYEAHTASLWAAMGAPSWLVTLEQAGHFTFSDLCLLSRAAVEASDAIGIGNVLEDGCSPENIPPAEAGPLINRYSIGLFNAVLRDSPGSRAFIDGPAGAPGALTLERR
jgi:predicted dienelactone hydrolase